MFVKFSKQKIKLLLKHDLYVQSNTLLLYDVFNKFQNKCLEIFELSLAQILSAWQVALKESKVKTDPLTGIDLSLIAEKRIIGRIYHAIHRDAKAITSTWKSIIKIKNLCIL